MRKRRTIVSAVVSAAFVLTAGGTAVAATFVGTQGPDRIAGSAWDDFIDGRGGNDRISGGGGEDEIRGGHGNDFVRAAGDKAADRVDCGPGFDTVVVDRFLLKAGDAYENCEIRRISSGQVAP